MTSLNVCGQKAHQVSAGMMKNSPQIEIRYLSDLFNCYCPNYPLLLGLWLAQVLSAEPGPLLGMTNF